MEFLDFTSFMGRRESNGLLSEAFVVHWIKMSHYWPGLLIDDDLNMYMMGGEL